MQRVTVAVDPLVRVVVGTERVYVTMPASVVQAPISDESVSVGVDPGVHVTVRQEQVTVTAPSPVVLITGIDLAGPRGPQGEPGPQGPQGIPGVGAGDTTALNAHIIDDTPHPAYDDIPSLTLLFINRIT